MIYQIIPGILEESQSVFQEKFKQAAQFARLIQVDIIDEDFANRVVNPDLAFTKEYNTPLELHLMVSEPEEWVQSFPTINIKRIIGHVERMENIPKFISSVKERSAEPFLGIDLDTNIDPYTKHEYIERGLKGFLIMTVKAGRSGQEFNAPALEKVRTLRQKFPDIDIEIDGGATQNTIPQALTSGANLITVTSAIFKSNDPELMYGELSSLLP